MRKLINLILLICFLTLEFCTFSAEARVNKYVFLNIKTNLLPDKIKIIFGVNDPNVKRSKEIKNKKIITDLIDMLSKCQSYKLGNNKLSQFREGPNKIIFYWKDSKKEGIFYFNNGFPAYDGVILTDGKSYFLNDQLVVYILSILEHKNPQTEISSDVINLFRKYSWTVDYLIAKGTETLPKNLIHRAGEYPSKLFWAYVNYFLSDCGFSLKQYLGENINYEIYKLREITIIEGEPKGIVYRLPSKGIVLRYNNKIIGAYIDAEVDLCSLKRSTFYKITRKKWKEIIYQYVDYNNEWEKKTSTMSPVDVIKDYIKALDSHDRKKLWAYEPTYDLFYNLLTNLRDDKIYNHENDYLYPNHNIKKIKLLSISEPQEWTYGSFKTLRYVVFVDVDFYEFVVQPDGKGNAFVHVYKENKNSGWKVFLSFCE